MVKKGFSKEKALEQAVLDAAQYEANLKKLMQLLTDQFSGDFSSLLDICDHVRTKILTDREEELAEIENINDIDYVEGLTVHSAKGLEFENVLIPFMNNIFYQDFRSEILVSKDNKKVGWAYKMRDKENPGEVISIANDQYGQLVSEEHEEVAKEETRLLYVAMTRAEYGLYCFVVRKEKNGIIETWADLLPEGKDNA